MATELSLMELESPIGTIVLAANGDALCTLKFADRAERMQQRLEARYGAVTLTRSHSSGLADRIRAYIDGDLNALDEIKVETHGTPFQRKVWKALRKVGAGTTVSYGDLARTIGQPSAVRAV